MSQKRYKNYNVTTAVIKYENKNIIMNISNHEEGKKK